MTALEQLAEFLATPGIAARHTDLLRRHTADIVCAWVAGGAAPEGQALSAFVADPSIFDQVALHCATARASEIDDIHLSSLVTPGAAIIPAAITLAANEPTIKASDFADAIAGGYEAMIRLGLTIDGPNILFRGIWPSYFGAPFGVAAVASRLWKMTPTQTAHALALSLQFASPNAGHQHGPKTSRWLAFGQMARAGAAAAHAARQGFVSDPDILEGAHFTNAYNITPKRDALTKNLGEQLAIEDLSFKPWCAARQTMAAAQAMRELIAEGVNPATIKEAKVAIPPSHVKMVDHGVHDGDRTSHMTSLPYQMAVAAFAPDLAFDVRQTPATTPDTMRAFMAKISVRGEDAFAAHYPAQWPARVELVSENCTKNERLVMAIPGDPARPFDDTQMAEKFARVADPVLGQNATKDLLALILDMFHKDGRAAALLGRIAPSQRT